jgi:hypothetical protein
VRDDFSLAISLDESRRRVLATLPLVEALENLVVQWRLITVLNPRIAFVYRQDTSSAITFDRELSLDTSIFTCRRLAAFCVWVQVFRPHLLTRLSYRTPCVKPGRNLERGSGPYVAWSRPLGSGQEADDLVFAVQQWTDLATVHTSASFFSCEAQSRPARWSTNKKAVWVVCGTYETWRRNSTHRVLSSSRKPRWTLPDATWCERDGRRCARKTSNFCKGASKESATLISFS